MNFDKKKTSIFLTLNVLLGKNNKTLPSQYLTYFECFFSHYPWSMVVTLDRQVSPLSTSKL
jgi:hypothetical protein